MANVTWRRPELTNLLDVYRTIKDALNGAPAIKGKVTGSAAMGWGVYGSTGRWTYAQRYLPKPNAADTSKENGKRYEMLVERAVFMGVAARTRDGMVGQVFLRDPQVDVPDSLDDVMENTDGAGLTHEQLNMRAVDNVLSLGRAGYLVDVPPSDGLTADQVANGDNLPTIRLFEPEWIINWRTVMQGSRKVLSMLVLEDHQHVDQNAFESVPLCQWRHYWLDPATGWVLCQLWEKATTDNTRAFPVKDTHVIVAGPYIIKDAKGKPLTAIPFFPIGARNNDIEPDKPPLQDLVEVNIAHYRDSADYQWSVFHIGQPTLVLAGLTDAWMKTAWGDKKLGIGSSQYIPLPVGGTAQLLQVQPNTMAKEAMDAKEKQMVALGAKLVESMGKAQTLGAAIMDETSESSVLGNVAKNVSTAFVAALKVAASFMAGVDIGPDDIDYTLNTEFALTKMQAADRAEVISEWQKGAIVDEEMRAALVAAGVATLDFDDWKKQVAIEAAQAAEAGWATIADPLAAAPVGMDPTQPVGPNNPADPTKAPKPPAAPPANAPVKSKPGAKSGKQPPSGKTKAKA